MTELYAIGFSNTDTHQGALTYALKEFERRFNTDANWQFTNDPDLTKSGWNSLMGSTELAPTRIASAKAIIDSKFSGNKLNALTEYNFVGDESLNNWYSGWNQNEQNRRVSFSKFTIDLAKALSIPTPVLWEHQYNLKRANQKKNNEEVWPPLGQDYWDEFGIPYKPELNSNAYLREPTSEDQASKWLTNALRFAGKIPPNIWRMTESIDPDVAAMLSSDKLEVNYSGMV